MNGKIYEGKRYENHELEQLIKDFKAYLEENPDVRQAFKAKVESNPYDNGDEQKLWFAINFNGFLSSCFPYQDYINGADYAWSYSWTDGTYKGSIEITKLPKK